jgi:hypothetical protein
MNQPTPDQAARHDDERYEQLSTQVEAEGFTIPADAVVTTGHGEQPGRDYLAPFMSTDELDAAAQRGRGRPRLSPAGAGRSPKRQVRLPDELDAALVTLAQHQGRSPSAVMRQAIEEYVNTA